MTEPKETKLHRIAVTGVIWRKESDGSFRYLITKRAPHLKIFANKWHVPGGGMETDDYIKSPPDYGGDSPQWYHAIERTLAREIKEEVNLEVDQIQFLLDVNYIRPDGLPVLVLSMFCRHAGGEVKLNDESAEYAWIRAEEVKNYDFIQGIDHEIELVEERLKKERF